jgi:hypothetical protein
MVRKLPRPWLGVPTPVLAAALLAGCHSSSDISSADPTRSPPTSMTMPMPSGGLGDLVAKPDGGAAAPVDPNLVKPWPDGGGGGGLDAATMKDDRCAGESQAAKRVPVDLLLLVDRSFSMATRTSAGGKSKWEMAQEALTGFIKDPKSAGLGVGLQYFPLVASCTGELDCGFGNNPFGSPACIEPRACVGTSGLTGSPQMCGARREAPCPVGTTCRPIGYCSEDGAPCLDFGRPCPAGAAGNLCTQATAKSCRDLGAAMCRITDYQRLAVPIAELPAAASPLVRSLNSTFPNGGTPTDPAAAAVLGELRGRASRQPDRRPVLVVVTDGLPNSCDADPVALIARLLDEAHQGTPPIPTYVVGVFSLTDLADGARTLDRWAAAGGSGMPFVLTAGDDLTQKLIDALNQIRGAALPCEYTIPTPSSGMIDYNKVNVHVSSGAAGFDIGYVGSADKCDPVKGGWYYDVDPERGSTPTRVIMCEATCKAFKMDTAANIELRFGCQTVVIQ